MARSRYNATVLRNKGVEVEVYALVTNEDGGYQRAVDANGNGIKEKRWVRFDNNAMADLEDAFGNLDLFEKASALTPNTAIRRGLAVCWEIEDLRQVGLMMVEGQRNIYSTAMGVALAIANGVDPTQAVEMLELGLKAVAEEAKEKTAEMAEMLTKAKVELEEAIAEAQAARETTEDDSPGSSGPEPGAEPEKNSTTSGPAPLLRSAS